MFVGFVPSTSGLPHSGCSRGVVTGAFDWMGLKWQSRSGDAQGEPGFHRRAE